jgi:hypothetical protein
VWGARQLLRVLAFGRKRQSENLAFRGCSRARRSSRSAPVCRAACPRSISGFRTFGFSCLGPHSTYQTESRGIEAGQRPEITKTRNDERPKEFVRCLRTRPVCLCAREPKAPKTCVRKNEKRTCPQRGEGQEADRIHGDVASLVGAGASVAPDSDAGGCSGARSFEVAGRPADLELAVVFGLAVDFIRAVDLALVLEDALPADVESSVESGRLRTMESELMQNRNPVGGGPSLKTCPR